MRVLWKFFLTAVAISVFANMTMLALFAFLAERNIGAQVKTYHDFDTNEFVSELPLVLRTNTGSGAPGRELNLDLLVVVGKEVATYTLTDTPTTLRASRVLSRYGRSMPAESYVASVHSNIHLGFPWTFASSALVVDYRTDPRTQSKPSGIDIPGPFLRAFAPNRSHFTIPTRIEVLGLLVNLVFWAACWLLFIMLLRIAQSAWRKFHLRRVEAPCSSCGYPLAGLSVCPECGTEAADAKPGGLLP